MWLSINLAFSQLHKNNCSDYHLLLHGNLSSGWKRIQLWGLPLSSVMTSEGAACAHDCPTAVSGPLAWCNCDWFLFQGKVTNVNVVFRVVWARKKQKNRLYQLLLSSVTFTAVWDPPHPFYRPQRLSLSAENTMRCCRNVLQISAISKYIFSKWNLKPAERS